MWELLSDVGPTGLYISEGKVTDTSHSVCRYFGLVCTYTSSRSDKFYFDDFIITGAPFIDVLSPEFDSLKVTSDKELILYFNEELDEGSTEVLTHYVVDNNVGNPTLVTLSENKRALVLSFEKSFSSGLPYSITISGIRDLTGNLISSTTRGFSLHPCSSGEFQRRNHFGNADRPKSKNWSPRIRVC